MALPDLCKKNTLRALDANRSRARWGHSIRVSRAREYQPRCAVEPGQHAKCRNVVAVGAVRLVGQIAALQCEGPMRIAVPDQAAAEQPVGALRDDRAEIRRRIDLGLPRVADAGADIAS